MKKKKFLNCIFKKISVEPKHETGPFSPFSSALTSLTTIY